MSSLRQLSPLRLAAAGLLALGLAVSAGAQVTTGALAGQAKAENDGSVLPGVAIQAIHVPTGTTYTSITGPDGRFTIVNVRVGGPRSGSPRPSTASAPPRLPTCRSAWAAPPKSPSPCRSRR